jgi:hypothetical protein
VSVHEEPWETILAQTLVSNGLSFPAESGRRSVRVVSCSLAVSPPARFF